MGVELYVPGVAVLSTTDRQWKNFFAKRGATANAPQGPKLRSPPHCYASSQTIYANNGGTRPLPVTASATYGTWSSLTCLSLDCCTNPMWQHYPGKTCRRIAFTTTSSSQSHSPRPTKLGRALPSLSCLRLRRPTTTGLTCGGPTWTSSMTGVAQPFSLPPPVPATDVDA